MEFKFRAVDKRPAPYLPLSSSIRCLPEFGFTSAGFSSGLPRLNTERKPNLDVARELVRWELEKEQIRREIMAAEIAPDVLRRRMLEAEVIRELIIERELGIQRNLNPGFSMHLNPRLPVIFDNGTREDQIAFRGSTAFNMCPVPKLPQFMAPETKHPLETNKDKLIILAKPDPDSYGAKRKAVTPLAVDGTENSPFGLKKKPKEEWSCALCQVSATSERALNEHLQGRRHKAKVAALRIQKNGKSTSTSLSSKKSEKSVKHTVANVSRTSGLDTKSDGQSLQPAEVACKGINQMVIHKDLEEFKIEGQLLWDKQNTKDLKKQHETPREVGETNVLKRKKRTRFWCDMCQVGASSQIVMESHMKGRKHMTRMKKLNQNNGSVPPTSSTLLSEANPLTKDTDALNIETYQRYLHVLSQESNMMMADNFVNSDESIMSRVAISIGDRAGEAQ